MAGWSVETIGLSMNVALQIKKNPSRYELEVPRDEHMYSLPVVWDAGDLVSCLLEATPSITITTYVLASCQHVTQLLCSLI